MKATPPEQKDINECLDRLAFYANWALACGYDDPGRVPGLMAQDLYNAFKLLAKLSAAWAEAQEQLDTYGPWLSGAILKSEALEAIERAPLHGPAYRDAYAAIKIIPTLAEREGGA